MDDYTCVLWDQNIEETLHHLFGGLSLCSNLLGLCLSAKRTEFISSWSYSKYEAPVGKAILHGNYNSCCMKYLDHSKQKKNQGIDLTFFDMIK